MLTQMSILKYTQRWRIILENKLLIPRAWCFRRFRAGTNLFFSSEKFWFKESQLPTYRRKIFQNDCCVPIDRFFNQKLKIVTDKKTTRQNVHTTLLTLWTFHVLHLNLRSNLPKISTSKFTFIFLNKTWLTYVPLTNLMLVRKFTQVI